MNKTTSLWTIAALTALTRLAGAADGFEAPEIEKGGYWVAVAIAAGAAVALAVLGFKNAKRTHLH